MDVLVIDHPLAKARLTTLRDGPHRQCRVPGRVAGTDRDAGLRGHAGIAVREERIHTPVAQTVGHYLANPAAAVPVVRAGLGMADQAHKLIPTPRWLRRRGAGRGHAHADALHGVAARRLGRPAGHGAGPMLATGGSMEYTIRLLTARGATAVIAVLRTRGAGRDRAPEQLGVSGPAGHGRRDQRLNDSGYIVPG